MKKRKVIFGSILTGCMCAATKLINYRGPEKYFLLLLLASSVLFFVNLKDSHDWGDDFAQYIHQAKNIAEGIPQSQTGYIFNERYPVYSPPAFTMGFPLMLAPVYYFSGNSIMAFNYLMSFFMLLFILFAFSFLSKQMKAGIAFLISLALLFNPLLLNLKTEIISDVPFSVFLLVCTMAYSVASGSYGKMILMGILTGILISIRAIGFAFIAAVLINEIFQIIKQKDSIQRKKKIKCGILFTVVSWLFYYLLNYVAFNLSGNVVQSPFSLFHQPDLIDNILHNLNYEMNAWQHLLFTEAENKWVFISALGKSVLLVAVVFGFFIRAKKSFSFNEIFVLVYLGVLLVYSYSEPGFRFLIPLIPFFMIYLYEFLTTLCNAMKFSKKAFIALSMIAAFLLYKHDFLKIIESQHLITEGPQRLYAKEIFEYIKSNTNPSDRIIFIKPRALALYTGRESFILHPEDGQEIIDEQIKEHKLNLVLTGKNLSDKAAENFIQANPEKAELVKSNENFSLYRIK